MDTRGSAVREKEWFFCRRSEVNLHHNVALAMRLGGELHAVNDDTCDGHGSHRGSPRHENGGRHYKSYGAALPAAV